MFTLMVCMRPKCTQVHWLMVFWVVRSLCFKTAESQNKEKKKIPRKTTVYKYSIQRNYAQEYQKFVAIKSPLLLTG